MDKRFQCEVLHRNQKLRLCQVSQLEKKAFNEFLSLAGAGNIFQTYEWGDLKKNYGWEPIRLILKEGEDIVGAATILKRTFAGMTILYSPRGPVLDYHNQPHLLEAFCRGIVPLARKMKASFWRIDPELPSAYARQILPDSKLIRAPVDNPFEGIQPKWVWRIHLANNREEQWRLLKKGARRQINKARKAGIKLREGNEKDLPLFYNLLRETARRNHFLLRDISYYKDLWNIFCSSTSHPKMLLAYADEKPVATALAIGFGQGVWDIYAGNSLNDKDRGASYLLTWKLITWAAEQGYVFYDLGGIAPQFEDTHPLAGLKLFKSRFGGMEVEFVGEHDMVFNRLSHYLWHVGQKSFKTMVGIKKTIAFRKNYKGQ